MIYIVTGENDCDFETFAVEAGSDLEAYAKIFRKKLEDAEDDFDDFEDIDDFEDAEVDEGDKTDDFDLDEYLEEVSKSYNDGNPVDKQWFVEYFNESDVCCGTGFAIISITRITRITKCDEVFKKPVRF